MNDFPNRPDVGRAFNEAAEKPPIDPTRDFAAAAGSEEKTKEPEKPVHAYRPPEPAPPGLGATYSYDARDVEPLIRDAVEERLSEPPAPVPDRDAHDELDFEPDEQSVSEYQAWSRDGEDQRNEDNTPESAAEFEQRMMDHFQEQRRDRDHDHDLDSDR